MTIDIQRLPVTLAVLTAVTAVLALASWGLFGLNTTATGVFSGATATLLVSSVVTTVVVRLTGRRATGSS